MLFDGRLGRRVSLIGGFYVLLKENMAIPAQEVVAWVALDEETRLARVQCSLKRI